MPLFSTQEERLYEAYRAGAETPKIAPTMWKKKMISDYGGVKEWKAYLKTEDEEYEKIAPRNKFGETYKEWYAKHLKGLCVGFWMSAEDEKKYFPIY
jgi:hypothetical protein